MKMTKLTAAIAATFAATAHAGTISGGDLDGVATSGGTADAVSAVAVVVPAAVADAFRALQGISDCDGSVDAACAPTISSAELRGIINGTVASANGMTNADGDTLGSNIAGIGKNSNWNEFAAGGVVDALTAFAGGGAIDGVICGQGGSPDISDATANDAATLAGMAASNQARIGFVHATELDGTASFVKLDGVAPSLVALMSSNYNLVSNLSSGAGASEASVNGVTVGVVDTTGGGVAYHHLNGSPVACAAASTEGGSNDVSGGAI